MMDDTFEILSLTMGDTHPYVFETTNRDTGAAVNPSSAVAWVLDPERETSGTVEAVDSGNTTTVLIDTSLTQADDFWVGAPLRIWDFNGNDYETEVTDFVQSSGALTFRSIATTVTVGFRYRLEGYPLLAQASASVSSNTVAVTVGPTDGTLYPGRRNLLVRVTFSSGQVVTCRGWFEVKRLVDG